MKQTAVEWLEQELKKIPFVKVKNVFEQAKAMEKEQHKETFKQSRSTLRSALIFKKDMPPVWESWEQYYKETFNTKEK